MASRQILWFGAIAGALLAYLFQDALVHGYVLGQADTLFDVAPWQSYKPTGWRIRNRTLSDIPTLIYPFLFHARSAVTHGELPLWSGAMGSGHPFFASFQTAVLSPFTLIDYLLPFPASFTADVAARLFAGGLGMFVFLRALPLGTSAALFGGVAFLLNPFSIVWLEHPLSAVAACLPWLLLSVDRVVAGAGRRWIAALAAVTAVSLLAGHPETAFKVLLFAGCFAIYRGGLQRRTVRTTATVLAAMLLGLLLTSIQIVPFLEYLRESRILATRQLSGQLLVSTTASTFVTAFVPDFYGTPLRNRFLIQGTNYCEQQVYAGIVTWLFAIAGLVYSTNRRDVIFFLSSSTIAFLVMYGTPVADAATFLIPPLRLAILSRFGLIAITGLIVAAAIGVDAIVQRNTALTGSAVGPVAWASAAGLAIATLVAAFLWTERGFLVEQHHWNYTFRSVIKVGELLVASVVAVWLAAYVRHKAAAAFAIALLSVDLLLFADGFHAAIPVRHAFPPIAELAPVQADPDVFRVAGWGHALTPNTAVVYGLQDFRSYDGIGIAHYSMLLDAGFFWNGTTHQLVNVGTPNLLNLLNIKYILAPQDIDLPAETFGLIHDGATKVYLNRRVQPRAFLVDAFVELHGDAARRAVRNGVDLTRTAVLAERLDAGLQPEAAGEAMGSARIVRYDDRRVTIETSAGGRRLLVLSDAFYPGWVATVDGVEAPIHRADVAFRAVAIPGGTHTIEFRYAPASFRYGAMASAAGVLILGVLLTRRKATAT